jgi:flagellar basal body-associated protein FliL
MKKPLLIAIISAVVLFIVSGVGYWYWQAKKSGGEVVPETVKEEVLPSMSTNPLDNKPDVNPINQVNPFNNVKTNPFE